MRIPQEQWHELRGMEGTDLKKAVFSIIQQVSLAINSPDGDDPGLLESVPRLADIIPKRHELRDFQQAYSALARASGLWNYIDKEKADLADAFVAESVTVPELGGLTLHREQVDALNTLFAGKNLILSAPTSFGKSLLVDALLASGRYQRVAIVLPTIALLDEFRRRLTRRFRDTFQIIMHPSDVVTSNTIIFLGTQERLITRKDLGALDLTVVDEFYKLDPARRDERSVTLNAAVYNLLRRSKQFFFLGPNIDHVNVTGSNRWKFEFLRTRFSTVAVDTYDLRSVANKDERLLDEIGEEGNWPALVFISAPDKANRLAAEASEKMAISDESADFATWLKENVGPNWPVAAAVENGFGVHHGRIPRAIAAHMVRLFNQMKLPVLFCTSTLIEGVNTAAKTVLIYDKSINRANYDFFTYSNIRGRAGRLGEHHVGQVFLFNDPPVQEEMEVSPTLFGDEDDAPDDFVVHIDEEDASDAVDQRVETLQQNLGLDRQGLRLASSIGIEAAVALKQHVRAALNDGLDLRWAGSPKYHEIGAVAAVICKVKRATEFGAFSDRQLTLLISKLSRAKRLKQFLNDQMETYSGSEYGHDNIFKFLRSCEYGLPQLFSIIELFVRQLGEPADYSYFVHELSRWFRPEMLKNLDEEGVPIQISERFETGASTRQEIVAALTAAVLYPTDALSDFEREWVAAALDLPLSEF